MRDCHMTVAEVATGTTEESELKSYIAGKTRLTFVLRNT